MLRQKLKLFEKRKYIKTTSTWIDAKIKAFLDKKAKMVGEPQQRRLRNTKNLSFDRESKKTKNPN